MPSDPKSKKRAGKAVRCHAGHRLRLRRKALHGLDRFEIHEAAELLLFESIPRRNTNETAHALTDRFGSLTALLKASPEELVRVPGIGPVTAGRIASVLPDTARRMTDALREEEPLGRWSLLAAADLRLNVMEECGAVLLLNRALRLTDWLPARDPCALLRLYGQAEERTSAGEGESAPAFRIVLIRRDAADRLTALAPTLRDCFPGARRILVLTPDRRMEEV